MIQKIRRWLGLSCCRGGEWTQWVIKVYHLSRPTTLEEDGTLALDTKVVEFTRKYQERRCTICGYTQREEVRL
jgi:hypothetical protein